MRCWIKWGIDYALFTLPIRVTNIVRKRQDLRRQLNEPINNSKLRNLVSHGITLYRGFWRSYERGMELLFSLVSRC